MIQSQLELRLPDAKSSAYVTASPRALATGFSALDMHLPHNGWPSGTVTEIFYEGAATAALQLVLPSLSRLSQDERWLAWIAPPSLPYRAQFRAAGINSRRVLFIRPHPHSNGLWAVEQALRSGTCAAALSWVTEADDESIVRLRDAAQIGGSCGLLFRPVRSLEQTTTPHLRLQVHGDNQRLFVRVLGTHPDKYLALRIDR